MKDFNEQIQLPDAAAGDPRALALAALDIMLASRPAELRRVIEAAALPHWFDEAILTDLLDDDLRAESTRWFQAVSALPAVERFPARSGFNVYEPTRLALRLRLLHEAPDRLRELSTRAAAAFSDEAPHTAIERIYHCLVAEPESAGWTLRTFAEQCQGRSEDVQVLMDVLEEYHEDEAWPLTVRAWACLLAAEQTNSGRSQAQRLAAANRAFQLFVNAGDEWATSQVLLVLGDLAAASGNSNQAQQHFAAALEIAQRLATSDPGNASRQRDLSIAYDRLGDVAVAQGQLATAQQHFTQGLTIRERLAASDPDNAGWQRDLSISCDRVADVAEAQGELATAQQHFTQGLTIRERLAASDPDNVKWQRDLSISHNERGNFAMAEGQLATARHHFIQALEIAEWLTASDPGNAGWQRDLEIYHDNLGKVALARGHLATARHHFTMGLQIAERLAASDPGNAGWQRDLWVSYWRTANSLESSGEGVAIEYWQKAHAILADLKQRGLHLSPNDEHSLEWLQEKLTRRTLGEDPAE